MSELGRPEPPAAADMEDVFHMLVDEHGRTLYQLAYRLTEQTVLFRGYFSEGRNIGDRTVLAELAAEAGLDRPRTAAFLDSDEGTNEVDAEEEVVKRAGLSGVPTFALDGRVLFSGAQPPQLIAQALARAPISDSSSVR